MFISRLVLGGGTNLADNYRPLSKGGGFLLASNSVYWNRIQFDYKLSKIFNNDDSVQLHRCGCQPSIYFPTPPSGGSTPLAPPQTPKNTLQFGFYYAVPGRATEPPVMLRIRLTGSRQTFDTVIRSFPTNEIAERRSSREQSFGLNADTYFRAGSHNVWGEVFYARTTQRGTTANRSQTEIAYMSRFPAVVAGPLLLRAMVTVGAVTGRGAGGLNIVNPAFEAFWHLQSSRVNIHLVWSPQSLRSGTGGWETHQQIALFVDRALYVHLFGRTTPDPSTAR
ncbi:MAG TPA: hypothetical protein VGQ46_04305 [Thermoanaerobaculia bacterium]|jgi:hypothetical protein|nr:hypothetical protein [Thermoanaerobaculia bacterium]